VLDPFGTLNQQSTDTPRTSLSRRPAQSLTAPRILIRLPSPAATSEIEASLRHREVVNPQPD
jgi:hypothetical protein